MSRVAVFIDAGYFWVQATHVVFGARGARTSLTIDYTALHKKVLDEVAAQFPGKDLLRVYWYDGPDSNGSKGPDHLAIDLLDDFKLRLGTRNVTGQQKAVDGMLISDLLTFAQSRAIENAILITGDADLTPGVVSAQALGLRVHLVTIGPPASTSPYLAAEADKKIVWDPSVVVSFAKPAAPLPAHASTSTSPPTSPAHSAAPSAQAAGAETSLPQTPAPLTATLAAAAAAAPQLAPVANQPPALSARAANPEAPAQQPPAAAAPASNASIGTSVSMAQGNLTQGTPAAVQPDSPAATLPKPVLPTLAAADFAAIASQARTKIAAGQNAGLLATASSGAQPLPNIVDRAVLRTGAAYAGRMLSEPEKRQLRIAFKALL
ncbi:NYN domain-containing protein [uncultured Massilia sp.]|uniref:NYN domain-containing protein n=1 Tax=uncultured Massilia sp. TaxID=169973 RepID=UPI0025EED792|nr:NYN domain-containing protein [uncultured Massilia sp.]